MIFYGDIAVPNSFSLKIKGIPEGYDKKRGFANLEGAISFDNSFLSKNVVFNGNSAIDLLKQLSINGVSLANNHITDLGKDISLTESILTKNGIGFCGYRYKQNDSDYFSYEENGKTYVVISFGWDVIGCKYPKKSKKGVNPLEKKSVLLQIQTLKEEKPDACIIVFPHWNYELQDYPLPMQREFAMLMIERGANIVIGCHPHCFGGIEKHKNGIIAYSLGNFYFASDTYMSKRLRFPQKSEVELALEVDKDNLFLHWFTFDRNTNSLFYEKKESVGESNRIREITPFSGLSNKEYVKWYKKNRKKSFVLPIFKKLGSPSNSLKKTIIKIRQFAISVLWKFNIKRSRSGNE